MQLEHATSARVAEALLGRRPGDELYLWQDREIRFDVTAADLELRRGEILLDYLVSCGLGARVRQGLEAARAAG
jgi:hypothetical protein